MQETPGAGQLVVRRDPVNTSVSGCQTLSVKSEHGDLTSQHRVKSIMHDVVRHQLNTHQYSILLKTR